jgi:hypothetical protein
MEQGDEATSTSGENQIAFSEIFPSPVSFLGL